MSLLNYKVELSKRRKKLKDLVKEIAKGETFHKEYSRISRIINGFTAMPPDFDSQVRAVLKKWDDEQKAHQ